jgi:mono/diheme cytochrome c family protein
VREAGRRRLRSTMRGTKRSTALFVAMALGTLLAGCKATPPGRAKTVVMTRAKHWVFVGGRGAHNPLAYSNESIADGKEAFGHYCVACHGLDGQNTGVPFADRMDPPAPSLVSREVQEYTDGQLKWVIDNGIAPSGMPGSKDILSDDEQWAIVLYLRHLPPAGSLGEPEMYGK